MVTESTSTQLNNLTQSFYNLSSCAWNVSQQLANISNVFYSVSFNNVSAVAWSTSTQLSNLSTACVSMNTSLINVSNVLSNISLVNLLTNYWKTNASLSTVLANYLTTQPVSISTQNACITNLSCTSIASSGNHTMANGLLYFNSNSNLATTYTGAVPWFWYPYINRLVRSRNERWTDSLQCTIKCYTFFSSERCSSRVCQQ